MASTSPAKCRPPQISTCGAGPGRASARSSPASTPGAVSTVRPTAAAASASSSALAALGESKPVEHPGIQLGERGEEASGVLAGEHAGHQHKRPRVARHQPPGRLGQGPSRVGIVAAVQPKVRAARAGLGGQRACGQALEPGRPVGRGDATAQRVLVDAPVAQRQGRGDRQAGVLVLIAAEEARRGQVEQAILGLHQQPAALLPRVEIPAHERHRRTLRLGFGLDHRQGFIHLARNDDGPSRPDDPGLLPGDLGELRTQELQVVVVDGGDHRHRRRLEDVGGVEPAAQAHLDDAQVGRRAREGGQRQDGGDLEEADRLACVGRLQLVGHGGQGLVADQVAGQADAFGEAHQVRRSQGVDLQPGGLARLERRTELRGAPVDDDQVGRLYFSRTDAREAARNYLVHHRRVIRTFDGFNLVFTVTRFIRHAVAQHDAARHRVGSLYIRNIVTFDNFGRLFEIQKFL